MYYCGNVCNEMMTSHCGVGRSQLYAFMADVNARKMIIIISGGRPRLGWMDGCLWQQRNDCGGCATLHGRVESPGAYVTD